MCGIFGWVLAGSRRQNYDALVSTTDLMTHRGPDGAGYWIGESANALYQIGLGHRRLSIIDIQGGAQPMWSADQTIALVFNGELYNYIELRKDLTALGHVFRTSSDTEVLIEAYRAWGPDAVARFRGMFAFLLWDVNEQRLLVARDQFGKKPIFISEMSDAWVFSSEIEPIMQLPGVDRSLDHDALQDYLLNRYVPGPSTLFGAVKKLPPGCYALWRNGHFSISRYYIPPFATTTPDVTDFNDAVQLFRETLEDSVRIRMRSDAPFGAFLSGGLDSSTIVGIMARQTSDKVRTFSVGFGEAKFSELKFARTIAQRFDTDHHEVVVDPALFMEHWVTAVLRRGAPVSEPADIPILILSKLASRTVKMVLTGEGSDELMGGYPKHRAERWIELYHRIVPPAVHDSVIRPAVRALPYTMRRAKIVGMAAGERELTNRMRVWFGGVTMEDRNALVGQAVPSGPREPYPFSLRTGSTVRRTLFFDQTSWLPDNLLERGDRMMMAGSIEGRMPFMDTNLAALVARFPDRFLVGKIRGKLVLRAAMDKILPKDILVRKKVGFRIPIDEWFRGPYRDFVRDMLTSDASQIHRICNGAVISQLLNAHLEGRANNEKILWSLVNLELFLRTFKPANIEATWTRAA
ncbi:asparagine synthase (glutamine-hydrolyzing) [Bradyrhizobium sp. SBR1B]|uniref:asparagine synthase (glutamine-hydrolyzing) n=1 Tax=Bradyrhizobium sp. SBR1B TaxID=2663836 RepID=UPI001606339C|nr:asparagine synthase (glutamine-hydrolyzing) [Bradyrhizobium sp. SBR1B]MBB4382491.1 asparagine synthase (glutamine-hydrolyzing) [Bradyrhizobium sp. SBR1B]